MFPMAVGDAPTTDVTQPTALQRSPTAATWTQTTFQIPLTPKGAVSSLNAVWGQDAAFVAVGDPVGPDGNGLYHGAVQQWTGSQWVPTGQTIVQTELDAVWGTSFTSSTTTRTDIHIGGFGGSLLHYDGNAHFYLEDSGTDREITGLWGAGAEFVRATQLGGSVLESNGTNVTPAIIIPPASTSTLLAVAEDPSDHVAIAVGQVGTYVRRTLAGWGTPSTVGGGIGNVNAVSAAGGTEFVAGAFGVGESIGGANFIVDTALGTHPFQGVWAVSGTEAFAVGTNGIGLADPSPSVVVHYLNGVWTQLATLPTPAAYAIWGSSPTDVYAVGYNGVIEHYDGVSWAAQPSGTIEALYGVWGAGANDVYVCGSNGTLLHYDGSTWHHMTSNVGDDLLGISGTSHSDVFAAGRNTTLHYNGANWQAMQLAGDLQGVWASFDHVYFAGSLDLAPGGYLAELDRWLLPSEGNCSDQWDNDGDGLVNCEDPDCLGSSFCKDGGVCSPTASLACGTMVTGTTGVARIDDLACLDHPTPGPEASYQLVAASSGTVTVTLDSTDALDLVELDPLAATGGCDVSHCTAADPASHTVTFQTTAGQAYYVLVDSPLATAGDFTLTVTCN
jgi:hypothetical protein